MNTKKKTIPKN